MLDDDERGKREASLGRDSFIGASYTVKSAKRRALDESARETAGRKEAFLPGPFARGRFQSHVRPCLRTRLGVARRARAARRAREVGRAAWRERGERWGDGG